MSAHDPELTILLIDDSPGDAEALRRALAREAPRVLLRHSISAEAALELLNRSPTTSYGLLMVDINLPGMDGIQLLRTLKNAAWLQSIPMVAWTSCEALTDVQSAYAAGADGYITKPSGAEDFYSQARFLNGAWFGDADFDVRESEKFLITKPVIPPMDF